MVRGVQPTCQPAKIDSTQPDLTQLAGLGQFLGLGGFGWVTNFF